jgi:hypothetical protein
MEGYLRRSAPGLPWDSGRIEQTRFRQGVTTLARKGRARRFREARELKQGFDDGLFSEGSGTLADVNLDADDDDDDDEDLEDDDKEREDDPLDDDPLRDDPLRDDDRRVS